MKLLQVAAGAALAAALISETAHADSVPMDAPITMGSVEAVCTGIGSAKDDPRWAAYPIRVEFSNGGAQYLSGAHVKLSNAAHQPLADFDCLGSWVLLKLASGTYSVTATIDGSKAKAKSATFQPPAKGQKRVVLQFKDFLPNQ
jgi:hypothetical protein